MDNFGEDRMAVFLDALVKGDSSGAIERQEARGQQKFVQSTALPKKLGFRDTREQYEALGIVFGEDVDDLFVKAVLPDGWHKEATEHSMWSNLVDDKGRVRASIFYKTAFYDRSSHMALMRRFSARVSPVPDYDELDCGKDGWRCVVEDCGEVVWVAPLRVEAEPEYRMGDPENKRQARLSWMNKRDELVIQGQDWLDQHYPQWRDPLAHWNEE